MQDDSEYESLVLARIRETIQRLQTPIPDETELLSLLAAPLDTLGVLPPLFRAFNTQAFGSRKRFDIFKLIPQFQSAILQTVAPAWYQQLREQDRHAILYQYFCPDLFSSSSNTANEIALCAYDSILSGAIEPISIELLCGLCRNYPMDKLFQALFSKSSSCPAHRKNAIWESYLRALFSLPTKVANFIMNGEIPNILQRREYFLNLSFATERLISSFKEAPPATFTSALNALFSKMLNYGLFTRNRVVDSTTSELGFFVVLPQIRNRLASMDEDQQTVYSTAWSKIWLSLPTSQLSKILEALFANLTSLSDVLNTSAEVRSLVKREAKLVALLMGYLEDEDDGKWPAISSLLLSRSASESARIIVCWAAISDEHVLPRHTLQMLLNKITDFWSSSEHIKYSLLSQHHAVTLALLLCVSAFTKGSKAIQDLSFSPAFIQAIGVYLSHLDPAVRRCGMLVAEVVAAQTRRTLDFGDWDEEGEGREWCNSARALLAHRDVDAEEASWTVERVEVLPVGDDLKFQKKSLENFKQPVHIAKPTIEVINSGYDSDDSIAGYASSTSSRATSPTPSELDEIEKDPTLNVGMKKIQKPVYLADLGNMLVTNAKPDDPQSVDRIEVALSCAEDLIRRKQFFGLELEENAVNLTHALVGLQNNFDLDDFDDRRQGAVTALVVCCPRKASPTIVEQFFGSQYSTEQRFVMLTALAMGARELASLSLPPSSSAASPIIFPSRQLPAALHKKYLTDKEHDAINQVRMLVDNITEEAAQSGKEAAEAKVPQIVRERQLRLKTNSKVQEIIQTSKNSTPLSIRDSKKEKPSDTFASIAAEYFLGPIIAKFWQHLRDEQTREERTALRSSTSAYRGAGTALVLNPLVLSQLVNTLAVLVHAARHSPAFLAIVAPDALELAVTVGTRPVSNAEESKSREAAVLTASLELALVVLDGCLDLDRGRSMGLEHTPLLLATGEWAGQVLKLLDEGVRVPGEGGVQEMRLRRSAAGLFLKVDELASRWRQSMIMV